MSESGRLTESEMNLLFANWKELITSNSKLLKYVQRLERLSAALRSSILNVASSWLFTKAKESLSVFISVFLSLVFCSVGFWLPSVWLRALRARKKMGGEKTPVQMIGDVLAPELSHMQAYIRFCSSQLNAAALLQQKTDQEAEFKEFLKVSSSSWCWCFTRAALNVHDISRCLTAERGRGCLSECGVRAQ